MPVRVPMLAAGQLDAALGYSFRLYVDLKDRGVPVDDIVQMQMPDYKLKLYGTAIIVNSKFATEQPEAVQGIPARDDPRLPRHDPQSVQRGRVGAAARGARQEGRRARAAAHGDPRERRHAGGARQRLRRDRSGAAGGGDRPDRARLHLQGAGRRPTPCSTRRSCRRRRSGGRTERVLRSEPARRAAARPWRRFPSSAAAAPPADPHRDSRRARRSPSRSPPSRT